MSFFLAEIFLFLHSVSRKKQISEMEKENIEDEKRLSRSRSLSLSFSVMLMEKNALPSNTET